jgi:hypothetical protein
VGADYIIVQDASPSINGIYQQATTRHQGNWQHVRLLSQQFQRTRQGSSTYQTPIATSDGEWYLGLGVQLDNARSEMIATKLPPFPGGDSINRGTLVPITIQLGSVPAGTNNIIAEFGYDTNLYCTSRQQVCVANQATVNETTPFYWASETYSGLGQTGGKWIITIPAIPQRVVYYRLKFRDAGGSVIATSATRAVVSP